MGSPSIQTRKDPGSEGTHRSLADLIEASAELLRLPRLIAVLPKILEISKTVIGADAYAVWAHQADKEWRILHAEGLSEQFCAAAIAGSRGSQRMQNRFVAEDVEVTTELAERSHLYRSENVRSIVAFPLSTEAGVVGTITFYYRSVQKFDERRLQTASALASIAAAALNTAELYEQQVRLREIAENERLRSNFLAEATATLASSLDYTATLNRVAELAVPDIADWCAAYVLNWEGNLERTAIMHSDPTKVALANEMQRRYPPELRRGSVLALAVATGEPGFYPHITEQLVRQGAQDEEHYRMLRRLGMHSVLIQPMKSREKVLGALVLVMAESDRTFTDREIKLAKSLATRAAVAVDNARLFEQAQAELAERIRTERTLSEAYEQLRYAQTAGKIGFYDWDVMSGKVTWSPEVPTLHGLVPNGDLHNWRNFIHPDDLPKIDAAIRTTSSKDQLELEYRIVKPDGSVVWLLTQGRGIYDEHGNRTRLLGVAVDITERKMAQQALQTAEMLASAGRLAATMAHEINNPLESVTNLIFLAKNDPAIPEQVHQDLELADQELSRVTYLAQQTLGFYRGTTHTETVEVARIAAEVLRLYDRKLAYKEVSLRTEIEADAQVMGVPGEIRQVLANLIGNAIDASPGRGVIALRIRRARNWKLGNSGVRITVADQGSGIPLAARPRIFEPFYTTKREVGTGLGLWVTNNIVMRHGGSIRFRSSTKAERSGTVFSVHLA